MPQVIDVLIFKNRYTYNFIKFKQFLSIITLIKMRNRWVYLGDITTSTTMTLHMVSNCVWNVYLGFYNFIRTQLALGWRAIYMKKKSNVQEFIFLISFSSKFCKFFSEKKKVKLGLGFFLKKEKKMSFFQFVFFFSWTDLLFETHLKNHNHKISC